MHYIGKSGGACTSTLLKILCKDEQAPEEDLSFKEALEQMQKDLQEEGYSQIP